MGRGSDAWLGSKPKIIVESFLTPEQKTAFRNMIEQSQQGVSGIPSEFTGGWPTFDQAAPGPNAAQQLSLAGLEQLAAGGSGGTAASGVVGQARDSLSEILGRGPTDFGDYFRTNVEDPLMEALNRPGSGIMSTLKKSNVGSGNLFGGEYQKARTDILGDTFDTMSRERAKMALDYRQQDTSNALAAMGMIPQVEGVEPGILSSIMQTAETGRLAERDTWQSQLDNFMRQMEEAWQRRQYASGLSTIQTQATMGVPGKKGILEKLAGSMMMPMGGG